MAIKKTWSAIPRYYGIRGVHVYEGHTLVDYRYHVVSTFEITTGPESGRQVELVMPTDQVRSMAASLIRAADRADEHQARL